MAKDYYSILGVSKSASQDEIKKAFRKLAHEHHPDKQSGNEAKFKEINEAYQVLGDKEKRSQYDQFGTTFDSANFGGTGFGRGGAGAGGFNWQDFARQYNGAQGFNFGQGGFQTDINFNDFDLGDIFGDFFGFRTTARNRSKTSSQAGEDIQIQMTIDFHDVVFGTEKIIVLEKLDVCNNCKGQGNEPNSKIITCPECNGKGQIEQTQKTIFGMFSSTTICRTCQGEGRKPEKFCIRCHGHARVKNKKEIKIKIPAGISQEETIKISGQGNAGLKTGRAGDLYVSFNIREDKEFERDGYNILSNIEINISQAALGSKILINTLDGPVNLKIPQGTQSGKVFVLKNKGVPVLNRSNSRGDHLVRVLVKIPTKLSRKQKKLLEELGREL